MLSGKIKNFISDHKTLLIPIVTMMSIFLIIGIIAYATTSNDSYVVEIKDDGSSNIAQNGESSITKKIVEDSTSSPKSLTYEVKVNNFRKRNTPTEVAVLIDNSKSMQVNDENAQIKVKAKEFVQNLYSSTNNVEVSIVNNTSVSYKRTNINSANNNIRQAILNSINSIANGTSNNLNDGIEHAISTFSDRETDKYLIIFQMLQIQY